jgi:hypothetical protein
VGELELASQRGVELRDEVGLAGHRRESHRGAAKDPLDLTPAQL